MAEERPGIPAPAIGAGDAAGSAMDTKAALGKIAKTMHAAHTSISPPGASNGALSPNQVLAALTLLRELRTEIAGWEPELIEAARSLGTSWADLAPALGVASRQAAERRYLRLRPAGDGVAGTGEQRVAAERDKRAGDKAVAGWARANAADLRQLAGQIGALTDLGAEAETDLDALRHALGNDDAAALLGPLADARTHLQPGHGALADRVGAVGRSTDEVRRSSDRHRRSRQ